MFVRYLFLHETLYARISLASSIVLIPRIVRVIYAKFHWAQRFFPVRNFITSRCAIVTGTSLSRSSSYHLTGVKGESDGEVRRVPTPHHKRSLPNRAHSLVATDRGRFIFDLPTYVESSADCITILLEYVHLSLVSCLILSQVFKQVDSSKASISRSSQDERVRRGILPFIISGVKRWIRGLLLILSLLETSRCCRGSRRIGSAIGHGSIQG